APAASLVRCPSHQRAGGVAAGSTAPPRLAAPPTAPRARAIAGRGGAADTDRTSSRALLEAWSTLRPLRAPTSHRRAPTTGGRAWPGGVGHFSAVNAC